MADKKPFAMRQMRDNELCKTVALPNAAAGSAVTGGVDTGNRTDRGFLPDGCEGVMKVPPLTTTMIPDTRTITLSIEDAADAAFTSPVTRASKVFTGAGGAGLPDGAELRIKLPGDLDRYVRGKAVLGASTTDSSSVTAEFSLIPDMGV